MVAARLLRRQRADHGGSCPTRGRGEARASSAPRRPPSRPKAIATTRVVEPRPRVVEPVETRTTRVVDPVETPSPGGRVRLRVVEPFETTQFPYRPRRPFSDLDKLDHPPLAPRPPRDTVPVISTSSIHPRWPHVPRDVPGGRAVETTHPQADMWLCRQSDMSVSRFVVRATRVPRIDHADDPLEVREGRELDRDPPLTPPQLDLDPGLQPVAEVRREVLEARRRRPAPTGRDLSVGSHVADRHHLLESPHGDALGDHPTRHPVLRVRVVHTDQPRRVPR